MISFSVLLTLVHLIGIALAVGAATLKLVLLLKCRADQAFARAFAQATRLITRQIIVGLILVTLSGVGWLLMGYPFTPRLVVKLVLVVAIWVIGPLIDNVVEPRFLKLAPAPGEPISPAFTRIWAQYVALETIATLLFYVVIVLWLLR
jgi:hypothetical protein